jgi:hypothetical protein
MSNSTATKAKATGSTTSRRSKKSQEVNEQNTITATLDLPQDRQEAIQHTDREAQVIAMSQLKLEETPMNDTATIALSPLPGNRPIASSDLKLSDEVSIFGKRPVDASNLQVLGTISALGERPVVASSIKVLDTISVSGERPIAASMINIGTTEMIMGNRPIAANYIDGDEDLMGYLD